MPVSVPNVPGVPAVVFAPVIGLINQFLTGDTLGLFPGASNPGWGIYSGGSAVVHAETVLTFDYRQQWAIADYPIEGGSFESYDKVATPFDARFRFATGGSETQRQELLSSIKSIAGNTQLYTVVTPEAVYQNVNITHYDYSRAAQNGLGLIVVDVWAQEIRVAASGGTFSTQDPTSAPQVNGGSVQTTEATPTQETMGTEIRGPHQELN